MGCGIYDAVHPTIGIEWAAMSIVESFKLDRPGGGVLRGVVDLPEAPGRCPTVVICHGFKGFMEWGFFPAVAELLAQRGFVTVRFNLAGSGMQPGDELVSDPQAFSANTYSAELADLLRVLEATGHEIADDRVDRGRLGLFGHSRGGGAAILAAASPPWRERIRGLVTWAAISRVDRYTPEEKRIWRATGELPVVNTRTGQQLALGRGLLEDVERHSAGSLDILAAAGPGRRAVADRSRRRRRERARQRGGRARRARRGHPRPAGDPRRRTHLRRQAPLRGPDAPSHPGAERHADLVPAPSVTPLHCHRPAS